jgi:hypothetical protein
LRMSLAAVTVAGLAAIALGISGAWARMVS